MSTVDPKIPKEYLKGRKLRISKNFDNFPDVKLRHTKKSKHNRNLNAFSTEEQNSAMQLLIIHFFSGGDGSLLKKVRGGVLVKMSD